MSGIDGACRLLLAFWGLLLAVGLLLHSCVLVGLGLVLDKPGFGSNESLAVWVNGCGSDQVLKLF